MARLQREDFGAWPSTIGVGKGLQHQIFLDNGPFTSERDLCSDSGKVPVLWFLWG